MTESKFKNGDVIMSARNNKGIVIGTDQIKYMLKRFEEFGREVDHGQGVQLICWLTHSGDPHYNGLAINGVSVDALASTYKVLGNIVQPLQELVKEYEYK